MNHDLEDLTEIPMAHIVWMPWREHSELLTVRSQLYPLKGSTGLDMRKKACSMISAWKLRGNLPHAVESTWFLTEAILTDDIKVDNLTSFAVRACYTTAFCRFVTGLVDSEQDAKHKVSMYIKAKQIGIPASFVELRHEATHGDLPSLVVLRKAAERSLEWLWNDYWRYLDVHTGNLDEDEIPAFKDGREKFKKDIRDIFCTHLKNRVETNNYSDAQAKTEKACLEIVRICKGGRLAILELVTVLLEYNMLTIESKIFGQSMDENFSLWDSLLRKLTIHQELFLTLLTAEMAIRITLPSIMDIKIDTYRESITMWLIHIYASKEWAVAVKRGKLSYSAILSMCLKNPNHWTVLLASSIIDTPGCKEAKAIYNERVAKAVAREAEPMRSVVRTISIENPDQLLPSQRAWLTTEEGLQEQEQSSQMLEDLGLDAEIGGWQKWKGTWIPKPIGIFS